jgi:hypothetical protein
MNLNHLLLLFLLALSYQINAQCPPTSAGQLSGSMSTILASDTTNAPVYSVHPAGLPNTEFIIIQNDSLATALVGPKILVSTPDGRFVPSDYNLLTCNEICVLPFSYDKSQLVTIVDSLFGATYGPGTSCCVAADGLFAGLCDSLVANGIASGADVTDLNDVITVLGLFAGNSNGTFSIESLTVTIDGLNSVMALFGPCSGGIQEICYAVSDTITSMDCYTIVLPNASTLVDITQDTIWLAPGATASLSAYYLPNSSSDSLTWYMSNSTATVSVVGSGSGIGLVTAGTVLDTNYVMVRAARGCATDITVVIVSPALAFESFNMTETPLQAIPNPFNSSLQVQFYTLEGDYAIELIGVTGRVYYSRNHSFYKGNQHLDINTEDIPRGYYFLRITGKNTQGTQSVIRQ